MTVEAIARSDVVTASPDTRVEEIARTMEEESVGSVVVTEGEEPVGLVTDRDLGLRVWDADDPRSMAARDVMTEDPYTVETDTGVYEALREAREVNVRRIPVVEDGTLVGIVTLDDFIVLLAGELEGVSDIILGESPEY